MLLTDLRLALRSLVRAPAFAAVAVITLALGVGTTTAIFSAVRAVLLRPPPFHEPDRLALLVGTNERQGYEEKPLSFPTYVDVRAAAHSFEEVAAWTSFGDTKLNIVTGDGGPEALQYAMVTASFFPLLRVRPVLGRSFTAEEDEAGSGPVVMLSNGVWRRRFAADPSILGQSIRLDGRPFTVIGVLPPSFQFATVPRAAELWLPFGQDPVAGRRYARSVNFLAALGRLRPGATFEQAGAEMSRVAVELAARFPREQSSDGLRVLPLREVLTRDLRPALVLMMVAVGFLLLIACANVANLFLVRAEGRRLELVVHAALGARRILLVRKLLLESVLLALAGGVLGVVLAAWLTDLLGIAPYVARSPFLPWRVPPESVRIDGAAIAFTLVLAVFTGLGFGTVPALRASRTDLAGMLRSGTVGSGYRAGKDRMRGALVVTQVALAFVLLASAGLAVRSLIRLLDVESGFDAEGVVTMDLKLPATQYPDGPRVNAFFEALLDRARNIPGTAAVGLVDALPLSGLDQSSDFYRAGGPVTMPADAQTHHRLVSPGYFLAMRIGLVRGRLLTDADRRGTTRVALINETMARRYWPGEDPVGTRAALSHEAFVRYDLATNSVVWDSAGALREIVGIVRDVRDGGPNTTVQPQMYVPIAQTADGRADLVLVARVAGDPANAARALRAEVSALDPQLAVSNINTMVRLEEAALARPRSNGLTLTLFAGLALLLACVGVYGLLAHDVSTRRHEIGVRLALGGNPARIQLSILRRGFTLGAIGVAIGLPLALLGSRLMSGIVFGVSATDPATLAGAALALLAAALFACWLPARRAASIDPVAMLRSE